MRILTEAGLKARYRLEYDAILATQSWKALVREVQTEQPDGETYGGAKGVRGPSERKGEGITHTVPAEKFLIYNRDFDGGLVIPRKSWEYNKTGEADFKTTQLAQLMAAHPGELIETAITAGTSATGPDGQVFFSAAHVTGSTTQSNLLTSSDLSKLNVSTATWPTPSEWADLLIQAAVYSATLLDDAGNKCNQGITAFTVCVPSGLYPSLLKALNQQFLAGGEGNILKTLGTFSFAPCLLTGWSDTDAFIMAPNGQSAFIYQVLEAPTELDVFGPGTEYYREKKELKATASGCYNCGYDRWQGAIHCTLS